MRSWKYSVSWFGLYGCVHKKFTEKNFLLKWIWKIYVLHVYFNKKYTKQKWTEPRTRRNKSTIITRSFTYLSITERINFPGGASGKESSCHCRRCMRRRSWVGKIPLSRKRQPTPVLLPGKSHRQRNLAGYSPWNRRVGHNWAHTHTHHPLIISPQKFQLDSLPKETLSSISS